MRRQFADHDFAPDTDVCRHCGVTRENAGTSRVCTMPLVFVMTKQDFETDVTEMQAFQRWVRRDGDHMEYTSISIPIIYGKAVLIGAKEATQFITNYMNAAAQRMMDSGAIARMPSADTNASLLELGALK